MTVTDVLSFIEDNLESKINIDTLCKYTGYGRRYIQIIFKKHINMTLWQYVKYRRITRAALLLRLTSSKIIDIAFRLQFDSQQTFNREFKKTVGCTPLQYRKNKDWDLKPILLPRTVNFKHPEPPQICFLDNGLIYGAEISYEQEQIETDKPYSLRWRMIDKYLHKVGPTVCLLTSYFIGKKSHDSVSIRTIIGNKDRLNMKNLDGFKYESGMYARMVYKGKKEQYITSVNQFYLVTLPYYELKRKEGYDIEIISKDSSGYKCELMVPVSVS
ncbi:helix-turn-helix domain-containing protein [Citrobacter cronae]|uniref:helix-turn-helix domain-containing protein n=1 Tax=Citrobacter cronae TaxID=1748967 RepID=UPI0021D15CAB|nr:helix-turn-helix domain-containing protein [Citrobacter cronae]MCU6198645.1 helix-turn-helix domain-containing protein [Citrobacter cronae]